MLGFLLSVVVPGLSLNLAAVNRILIEINIYFPVIPLGLTAQGKTLNTIIIDYVDGVVCVTSCVLNLIASRSIQLGSSTTAISKAFGDTMLPA